MACCAGGFSDKSEAGAGMAAFPSRSRLRNVTTHSFDAKVPSGTRCHPGQDPGQRARDPGSPTPRLLLLERLAHKEAQAVPQRLDVSGLDAVLEAERAALRGVSRAGRRGRACGARVPLDPWCLLKGLLTSRCACMLVRACTPCCRCRHAPTISPTCHLCNQAVRSERHAEVVLRPRLHVAAARESQTGADAHE